MLRFFLTVIFFCIALSLSAQRTVDTSFDYNGRIAKATLVYDEAGNREKLSVFYENGKVEIEYFFLNNTEIRWVYFDSAGRKTMEWNDQRKEMARLRLERNLVLLCVSVLIGTLIWGASKQFGFERTYFVFAFATIAVSVSAIYFQKLFDINKLKHIVALLIAAFVLLMPAALLLLSIRSFGQTARIGLVASIGFTLFSLWMLLMHAAAMLFGGSGFLA